MTTPRHDFYIKQGSNKVIPIQFTEDNDDPINITGYKFAMQIRPTYDSTQVYDTLTTSNGRIEVQGTDGKIIIKFPSATTRAYDFVEEKLCSAVYELDWYIDGEYETKLEGDITIAKEVTNVDLS